MQPDPGTAASGRIAPLIIQVTMTQSISLVIATRNHGKTAEIRDLLKGYPIRIPSLDDFGPIPPVEEDGDTFEANAYKKASFTARVLGLPAMADDSGLVVEALGGAPGVHSARYAGPDASDEDRCRKLLQEMEHQSNRGAAFECVISVAVPGGPALIYEARCEGIIAQEPVGANGFGYDPVFFYPPMGKTFAQMTMDEKSRISHRGKALRELREEFEKVLTWVRQHTPIPETFICEDDAP
ncbi:Nucleoside 5-triphosphatase RdgB (dHAPTP, dITP, XTP-specific) (EC [Olavius algarvensis associated proteobacterium Delta 3]|nr:Nucleoside 5-triphosphatase RdgB (dHAPTP, dITP, XTP-specific) (EC [Olavius algarvensis associated proteobacterium Delta 3]